MIDFDIAKLAALPVELLSLAEVAIKSTMTNDEIRLTCDICDLIAACPDMHNRKAITKRATWLNFQIYQVGTFNNHDLWDEFKPILKQIIDEHKQ